MDDFSYAGIEVVAMEALEVVAAMEALEVKEKIEEMGGATRAPDQTISASAC